MLHTDDVIPSEVPLHIVVNESESLSWISTVVLHDVKQPANELELELWLHGCDD